MTKANGDGNPFLITPPPGLMPARVRPAAPQPEAVADAKKQIGLPPGVADSATHRLSTGPVPTPRAFFAAPPGARPRAAHPAETGPSPAERSPVTTLVLPGGERHPLTHSLLIGRDPAVTADWVGADRLAVVDTDKSVSKTHAGIRVDSDGVWIHDLNSTNGVTVIRADGRTFALARGGRLAVGIGDRVALGNFEVLVIAD